jgi:two-component system sensor histidine kinase ChvG
MVSAIGTTMLNGWRFSPITLRILAVNVGALLVLGLGLLYSGQYEKSLVHSELDTLVAEGQMLSAAFAEGGTRETLEGNPVLVQDLSRHLLRKLVETKRLRVLLFDKTGHLIVDSHQSLGAGGIVQMLELNPPFQSWPLKKQFTYLIERALDILPSRFILPPYPKKTYELQAYPHLMEAMSGESFSNAWRDIDNHVLLTATMPIQNLKKVLGAAVYMRSGDTIDRAVLEVQFTVLKLFLWVLLATLILSLYLSETIAKPIVMLAATARKLQLSLSFQDSIPDLSYRHDEIGDLSTAFIEMAHALAERIDAISSFAADVAHEIKNPLASVKSAVETLPRIEDPVQRQKLLSVINEDVDRMTRLINDISNASRLDSELVRTEKNLFDMAELLRNIVALEIEKWNLKEKITLQIPAGKKFWVTGNDVQIAQVICNLLDNAVSFVTPAGTVEVNLHTEGGKVIVYIDNNGIAIPPLKLEAIFERFYSERPTQEKFGLHSGLGLSISRQIIRAHKGSLFASNLKTPTGQHHGVRFTVILPAGAAT